MNNILLQKLQPGYLRAKSRGKRYVGKNTRGSSFGEQDSFLELCHQLRNQPPFCMFLCQSLGCRSLQDLPPDQIQVSTQARFLPSQPKQSNAAS